MPDDPAPLSKNTKSLGTNWQEIAIVLNKLGNTKSWQNWIKCFREIKLTVKIKLKEQRNGKGVIFSPSDSKVIAMCHLHDSLDDVANSRSIPIIYVKQENELDIRDDYEDDTNRDSLRMSDDDSPVAISSQTNEDRSQSATCNNSRNNIKQRRRKLRIMHFLLRC